MLETLFLISNILVLPFWFLMVLLPHWRWSLKTMQSPLIALPVAALYTALVLPALGELAGLLANPTLAGISAGLGTPQGALVAWAHLLAFDLFAGRWVYLDSRKQGISAWLVSPVLLFVFMLGPFGLLLYLLLKWLTSRS